MCVNAYISGSSKQLHVDDLAGKLSGMQPI